MILPKYAQPKRRKSGPTPIPAVIRDAVEERADGHCEHCGKHGPTQLHHRLFLSRGGEHSTQNLIAVCGLGNASGCHGLAHSGDDGAAVGLAIPRGQSAVGWPVLRWTLGKPRWCVLLTGTDYAVIGADDAEGYLRERGVRT